MTTIRTFIRDDIFRRRLEQSTLLVVYDPARRYRDLCLELATPDTTVVDASLSGIESRETAMQTLLTLAHPTPDTPRQMLIYVPAPPPRSDEERTGDPFGHYGICGTEFPASDGDDYINLCLKAKPDHATDIRRLFDQNPDPSFELVDNLGTGIGYPMLRTLLSVDSARNILLAFLTPSDTQQTRLREADGWLPEARTLCHAALGLKLTTRGKTWSAIADELWRFLLFSEFAAHLPATLPAELASVPRAPDAARPLVEDLCETLRNDNRSRPTYIERAEQVERELNLPDACANLTDLGPSDTFPFTERSSLAAAVTALREDRLDEVRQWVAGHRHSVWLGKGESQAQWGLLEAALQLVVACDTADTELPDHSRSLDALLEHYLQRLRELDRLQRQFEQAVGEYICVDHSVDTVIDHTRERYTRLAGKIQHLFSKHLETSGWPPQGRLANADVFDRLVAPHLQERGQRIGYFMVDALRYELGLELHRQLQELGTTEIQAACAQLPTITPVGMASLLPGAGSGLRLAREANGVVPSIDGQPLPTVKQRMELLRTRYGDRFQELTLKDFIKGKPKTIPPTVELLVLRSTEIDSHLESNPDTTLGTLSHTLRTLRVAVHRLKEQGFSQVIIATDHGFFLNGQPEAGDVCTRPPGDWTNLHDRALLGEGASDAQNLALPVERVGIRADFSHFASPRSLAPYRRGLKFFHGGASLPEALVPVITVQLRDSPPTSHAVAQVSLNYKNGAKRITTRVPVVMVAVHSPDMFSQDADIEILLEALDRRKNIVGEARRGEPVNPATGILSLKPGQSCQVSIRMDLEFEGKFSLRAVNPETLATYATLELETDYAV